jgi:hypothetical protein
MALNFFNFTYLISRGADAAAQGRKRVNSSRYYPVLPCGLDGRKLLARSATSLKINEASAILLGGYG